MIATSGQTDRQTDRQKVSFYVIEMEITFGMRSPVATVVQATGFAYNVKFNISLSNLLT